ncbi:MAG TPA: hypothetical protein VM864_08365 [Pyrinomonadaceae bacterium]|jgi:hypothetical protein|nr:hypothetical protein [Pyrinomonadaceae bacterium]
MWRAALAGLLLCAALSAAARAQAESLQGRWAMEVLRDGDAVSVMLERRAGGVDKRFFQLKPAELSGITREEITSGGAAVNFQLRRRVGTFNFSGTFAAGRGAGTFSFTVDPEAAEQMRREGYGEALRQDLFGIAIGNHGGRIAEDLAALGVERPTPEQLQDMTRHGVSAAFIDELKALGYEPRSVSQLIDLRRFGVSAARIKELMALGYERPPLDVLIDMGRQGVSTRLIEELGARGYERPPLGVLVQMRQQGVTVQFIDELKALGYDRVPLTQLVSLRQQGVTPAYIRQLNAQGFTNIPVNQLFNLRTYQMPVELLNHLPPAGEREKADGEWLMKFYGRDAAKAWLLLSGSQDGGGHSVEISAAQLRDLTAATAFSGGAPVRFTIALGGRTLSCTGWFKDGYGAGVFTATGAPAAKH